MSYEVLSTLDSILGPGKQFSKGEYYYFCPFCHHYNAKLAVNIVRRKWQCWKCKERGSTIISLLKKLNVPKAEIAQLASVLGDEIGRYKISSANEPEPTLRLPYEFKSLVSAPDTIPAHNAWAYLMRRGFTDQDIVKYNIGFCETGRYANRVIIPSYDDTGKLNFFVGRDFYGSSGLNYLVPPVSKNIIGFEYYINWRHPIVLVEGAFDAMAVKRNGIPLYGKTLPKRLQEKIIKEGVNEIYLALDLDALSDTVQIAEKFMGDGIAVYVVDLDGKDPAKLGFAKMQHLMQNARRLKFSDLMHLKLKLMK